MTDKELLEDCLRAFDAIPVAARARKILKQRGQVPGAYAGNGSHILAGIMAKEIRAHLHPEQNQALREVETKWLADALNAAICNLGYPVGCGQGLHPNDAKKAANKLFDRYLKMIEMARAKALADRNEE